MTTVAPIICTVGGHELRLLPRNSEEALVRGTGVHLWDSSVVLARILERDASKVKLKGAVVVELGAGLGLGGLAAAVLGAGSVVLTDLEEMLPVLEHNVNVNRETAVHSKPVDKQTERVKVPDPLRVLKCDWGNLADHAMVLHAVADLRQKLKETEEEGKEGESQLPLSQPSDSGRLSKRASEDATVKPQAVTGDTSDKNAEQTLVHSEHQTGIQSRPENSRDAAKETETQGRANAASSRAQSVCESREGEGEEDFLEDDDAAPEKGPSFPDLIIGADVVFNKVCVIPLLQSLWSLSSLRTRILLAFEKRCEVTFDLFLSSAQEGFDCRRVQLQRKGRKGSLKQTDGSEQINEREANPFVFVFSLRRKRHANPPWLSQS